MHPTGPGEPFALLFDDDDREGLGLPPELQAVYGGDLRLPPAGDLPHLAMNFVVSHDGRVSFLEPGHDGGGDVSGFDRHDAWLMALLRARADAVLVGAGTLRVEPAHRWTAAAVFPDDAAAWAELRAVEARSPHPLQVFVTASGRVPADAAVLDDPELAVVIVTTGAGENEARRRVAGRAELVVLGDDRVDLVALARWLRRERGAGSVLCEGGPHLYGSLLAHGLAVDEFLTWSPVVAGNPGSGPSRPALVEGWAWAAGHTPRSVPLSLRRAGHHLFLRSRVAPPPAP